MKLLSGDALLVEWLGQIPRKIIGILSSLPHQITDLRAAVILSKPSLQRVRAGSVEQIVSLHSVFVCIIVWFAFTWHS
jgi:hypothetical protein